MIEYFDEHMSLLSSHHVETKDDGTETTGIRRSGNNWYQTKELSDTKTAASIVSDRMNHISRTSMLILAPRVPARPGQPILLDGISWPNARSLDRPTRRNLWIEYIVRDEFDFRGKVISVHRIRFSEEGRETSTALVTDDGSVTSVCSGTDCFERRTN